MKWDLTKLFKDSDELEKYIENIKNQLDNINKYENITIDSSAILEMLDYKWNIKEQSNKTLLYGSLRYYQNVNSEENIELKKQVEQLENRVDSALKIIDKKIIEVGKDKIEYFYVQNSDLKKYRFSIDNLFRLRNHLQDKIVNDEINIYKNKISNELKKYNDILRDIEYGTININGKEIEINKTNFAKYISSRDRETRMKTYLLVNESYKNNDLELSNILNSIYSSRDKIKSLEKYETVLDKALFEENIDENIISSLITSVHKNIGMMQEYLKLKIDNLNITDPHLYDFTVPLDNDLKIKYTLEEAKEIIKKALNPLGDKYLEVVEILFNEGYIEAEVDDNKHQSITFSWNTYAFMNFRGSYIDIKNLIHELGHIVNYYLSKEKQPFIYKDSTVFVGETASIVNEILLNKYLYENAKTSEEKIFYLSKEIENYFTSVFKQTMYTEFENKLYELINLEGVLISDSISNSYLTLIKEYYGHNIVYDEVAKAEWTRLGHLYRWSYYPYKYATGLIMASSVANSIINRKEGFIDEYIDFLSSGSNDYSLELLKKIDVDLTINSNIDSSFELLRKDISQLKDIITK